MTPLANEFINQVRYNGFVNIVSSLVCFLLAFIVVRLAKKISGEKFINNYHKLTPEGFFLLAGAGVLISSLMIIGVIALNKGLSEMISPLCYLLNK